MSVRTVNATIERIRSEPGFALDVASRGGPALAGCDLSRDEQNAIVDALRRDIQDAADDVEGFGRTDRVEVHDLSVMKFLDKSSPNLMLLVSTPEGDPGGPGTGPATMPES